MNKHTFGCCSLWIGVLCGMALAWGIQNKPQVAVIAFLLSIAVIPGWYCFLQSWEYRKEKKALLTPKQ